ncbi:hypothetical protein D3C85_1660780 [compost metagenome]
MAGLGIPRGDHGFMVGSQFGVGELIFALIDRRLGLIKGSLGGFQLSQGIVQLRLCADPAIKQRLLPLGVGLGIDQLRLDFRQVALGRA